MIQKKKSICVVCNGCNRRMLDAEKLKNYFKSNNFEILETPKNANFIVFIPCAFINQREEESIKIIQKLKKYKGELIIVGCLPEIAKKTLSNVFKGKIISTKNIDEIDKVFKNLNYSFTQMPDANFVPVSFSSLLLILSIKNFTKKFKRDSLHLIKEKIIDKIKSKFNKKTTYYLRISYGCLGNCSYCGIRKAIGILKSKPIDTCLKEYKEAISKGYKNLVILADDTGAYGLDIKSSFSELLNKLITIDKNNTTRWSIKELHPRWMIKYRSELADIIRTGRITHILCGIQSGNDRILKLMNRYHDSKEITLTLQEFRKTNPDLKLSTQIIVGFPSETEREFLETLNLLKSIKFNEVIIYPYSERKETISEKLKDKISDKIKKERIKFAVKFLKKEGIKSFAECL